MLRGYCSDKALRTCSFISGMDGLTVLGVGEQGGYCKHVMGYRKCDKSDSASLLRG